MVESEQAQVDQEADDFTGCLSFLNEGAGRTTIALVYLLCVLLALLGCWLASFSPALGGPLLALSAAMGVTWFFFEREYRPLNPQAPREARKSDETGEAGTPPGEAPKPGQDEPTEPATEGAR